MHATTEVNLKFSEAPHSRSSIPHLNTDLEKTEIATPRAQVFMGKKRKTQNDIPAIQLLGTSSVATVEESR